MDYIPLNYYTISLLIGGFTAGISGLLVIMENWRKQENQAWFALTLFTSIWSFAYFFMTIAQSKNAAWLGNWILHFAAIYIPLFYYLLILVITNGYKKNKLIFYFFVLCSLILSSINFSPDFIHDVVPKVGFNYAPSPGILYKYFFYYFDILVIIGIVTTLIAAYKTDDHSIKSRLYFTILFTIAASVGGGSVFLTTFSDNIPPYLLILFSVYPLISVYAIFKHKLFNVKVIGTEISIITLWIFIFFRLLLATSLREQIADVFLLVATIILGIMVIRGVQKEIAQRLRIEGLADQLKLANQGQVNLMHIMNHQIKGRLGTTKNILAELLMTDDYGKMPDEAIPLLKKGLEEMDTGVNYVQGILKGISAESGSLPYDMQKMDFKSLVQTIFDSQKDKATQKGLSYELHIEDGEYSINGDKTQLSEAIKNLIDNSIAYTPSGNIFVNLEHKGDKILFAVRDTGVGLRSEDKAKLFTAGGRGKDSIKINVNSTGYGLAFVKGVVEAHKGRVWAESQGEGKGSQFYLELPI